MSEVLIAPEFPPLTRAALLENELSPLKAERADTDPWMKQILWAGYSFRDGDYLVCLPLDGNGTAYRIAQAVNQALAHDEQISGGPA